MTIDAWMAALFVVVTMLVAWECGFHLGRRFVSASDSRVDDASLALLGLILAFSFSTAAAKHDRRKLVVLDEATAIGDFAGSTSMLGDPEREALRGRVREYTDLRIASAHLRVLDPRQAELLGRTRTLQSEMTANVERAIRSGNTPSIHPTLLATLNAMTTAFEARQHSMRDHVPTTILCLLMGSSVCAALLMGRTRGGRGVRRPFGIGVFVVLVGLVIFVTLDLEQPARGIIRVPSTALESVRTTL